MSESKIFSKFQQQKKKLYNSQYSENILKQTLHNLKSCVYWVATKAGFILGQNLKKICFPQPTVRKR
jgi:hypothetical protein